MRANRAKAKLLAGEPVLAPTFGIYSLPDLATLEYLASQDALDVAWIEMEHGPVDWRDIGDIARACDLWGVTSLVRVTSNEPALIARALDLGAQAVLVPHVCSRGEAERVVEAAYYAPLGRRGIGLARQSFGVDDYYAKANAEVLSVVLIEDVRAIEQLDEMLQVEGIDVFFVAPGDLSQTMGAQYLGKPFHPDVQALVQDSIARIAAAGRIAGTVVTNDNMAQMVESGARLLRVSAMGFMVEGMQSFRCALGDALAAAPKRAEG